MSIQLILESVQQQLESLTVNTVKQYNTLNNRNKFRQSIERYKDVRQLQTKDYNNNDVIRYEYPDIEVFAEVSFEKGVDDKGILLLYKGKSKFNEKNYSYALKGNSRNEILKKANDIVQLYIDRNGKYDLATKTRKADNIKVGDIFVGTWGYDQTNVSSYQVVKLSGKQSVVVRELNNASLGKPDSVIPSKNNFKGSKEYLKKLSYVTGKPSISIDNVTAQLWDGKTAFYETPLGQGR